MRSYDFTAEQLHAAEIQRLSMTDPLAVQWSRLLHAMWAFNEQNRQHEPWEPGRFPDDHPIMGKYERNRDAIREIGHAVWGLQVTWQIPLFGMDKDTARFVFQVDDEYMSALGAVLQHENDPNKPFPNGPLVPQVPSLFVVERSTFGGRDALGVALVMTGIGRKLADSLAAELPRILANWKD